MTGVTGKNAWKCGVLGVCECVSKRSPVSAARAKAGVRRCDRLRCVEFVDEWTPDRFASGERLAGGAKRSQRLYGGEPDFRQHIRRDDAEMRALVADGVDDGVSIGWVCAQAPRQTQRVGVRFVEDADERLGALGERPGGFESSPALV